MLELFLITVAGVLLGALTGAIPGLHPNTVVFSSFPIYFGFDIGLLTYTCFITGLSVSHTFHDFLPAIYLSAPSAESAVASLPGAQMAKNGKGKQAFTYTVLGGLTATLLFIPAAPLLYLFLEMIYTAATKIMAYILMFFLLFIIINSGKKASVLIVGLSGVLGILAFQMPVNQNFVLMPVFAGLFAVPAVLQAISSDLELPEQEESDADISLRGGAIGFLAGLIAGTVPGVGAGASTSFLSPLIEEKREILSGLGAVNTSDIFMSFIALFVIEKARSGASVAVQALGGLEPVFILSALGSSFLAVGLSVPLSFRTQEIFLKGIKFLNMRKALYSVLLIVTGLTFYFTGFYGLLALVTSSFIGFLAWEFDCRICPMAVLIVPALAFYLGVGIFI